MDAIPHLAWPITFANARYATNDQDTDAEVIAAVAVIVSFEKGYRAEDPAFGITDPTFSLSPVDTDDIISTVTEYEPRAEINVSVDEREPTGDSVHIEVRQATGE